MPVKLAGLKRGILKNRQLIIGLGVGALIMLPTGLYVNGRNSNRQADQPSPTQETKADNDSTKIQNLDPVTGQPTPTQNNSQSSGGGTYTPSTTPTSTYKSYVCTTTVIPYTTSSQIASYLGSNEYKTNMGDYNGSKRICTAPDSNGYQPPDLTLPAGKLIIYVGTGGITASTPPRTTPAEPNMLNDILNLCGQQLAGHGNQEAYQLCVNIHKNYHNL